MIRRKKLIHNILYSQKFLATLGLVIIILISFPLIKNIRKHYEVDKEIKNLEQEINNFKSKNVQLENLITYLESYQFVEEQGRLNLDLKKKGEKVVVIKEEDQTSKEVIEKKENEELNNSSNLYKWWSYFFN